jgi:hypothetical protein
MNDLAAALIDTRAPLVRPGDATGVAPAHTSGRDSDADLRGHGALLAFVRCGDGAAAFAHRRAASGRAHASPKRNPCVLFYDKEVGRADPLSWNGTGRECRRSRRRGVGGVERLRPPLLSRRCARYAVAGTQFWPSRMAEGQQPTEEQLAPHVPTSPYCLSRSTRSTGTRLAHTGHRRALFRREDGWTGQWLTP